MLHGIRIRRKCISIVSSSVQVQVRTVFRGPYVHVFYELFLQLEKIKTEQHRP